MPKIYSYQQQFEAHQHQAGIEQLDKHFLTYLKQKKLSSYHSLLHYREQKAPTRQHQSKLILQIAPDLEAFINQLFAIESAVNQLRKKSLAHQPVFQFKSWYVLKQAKRKLHKQASLPCFADLNTQLNQMLSQAVKKGLFQETILIQDRELAIATLGNYWRLTQEKHEHNIQLLIDWCIQAMTTQEGQAAVLGWSAFQLPTRYRDQQSRVETEAVKNDPYHRIQGNTQYFRERSGFTLTEPLPSTRKIQSDIHYCIYCHQNQTDFCATGFPIKKNSPELGFKKTFRDHHLTGCPLEEHISEMHLLKKEGYSIGAIAAAMVENPFCAVTGHRICNDCMQSCIYQKQDPVNIPLIESHVLKDVLTLPWGVEIYHLLVQWNPLRFKQWMPKAYNKRHILIMGMGPAGFTLAHHLLMEGFAVVGVDGLKVEKIPPSWLRSPIKYYQDIEEKLDSRLIAGFGGVCEYGITVRWDKNFLKLIYLSLCRRPYFQLFSGVRFGGNLQVHDAWKLGFDHMAIAVGAGLPKALPIPGSLAPGMRHANDFLMALQLTGAFKKSTLSPIALRLPSLIIGSGLTAVDTATEVQAYYLKHVEMMFLRYQALMAHGKTDLLKKHLDTYDQSLLMEWVRRGEHIRLERSKALRENRPFKSLRLLRQWGGVTLVYRKSLKHSPAYQQNPEELKKALQEGIYYREGLNPIQVNCSETSGRVKGLVCEVWQPNDKGLWEATSDKITLPASSIFVATGAKPNIAYHFEHKNTFLKQGDYYQRFEQEDSEQLVPLETYSHCKAKQFGPLTSYQNHHYRVSFLGDTHPVFQGSVVKAMASGKRTYPVINKLIKQTTLPASQWPNYAAFKQHIQALFASKLLAKKSLAPNWLELTIQAPFALNHYQPGQFYRIQSFEAQAIDRHDTLLYGDGFSAFPYAINAKKGSFKAFIFQESIAQRLASTWEIGQPLHIMGPTGARCKIPKNQETICFIVDRWGFSEMMSIIPSLFQAKHEIVVYLTKPLDIPPDLQTLLKRHTHLITSPQLYNLGDIFQSIHKKTLSRINRILVLGQPHLVQKVQQLRRKTWGKQFFKEPIYFGSIYGPLQCMLKGVCAQCLQWQVDPKTGKRTKAVFACSWQTQPLEGIDFKHLKQRNQGNALEDQLSHLWLDVLMEKYYFKAI